MSFHAADLQRLEEANGAALRVYQYLVAAAEGAQTGSLAETRKIDFENDWMTDPEKVMRQAEAMEKLADRVTPDTEPEPKIEDQEEDDDDEPKPKSHKGRHR